MAGTDKRFKKGDRVRVSEPRFHITYGKHGVIEEVRSQEDVDGGLYQYHVRFDETAENGVSCGPYDDSELEPS